MTGFVRPVSDLSRLNVGVPPMVLSWRRVTLWNEMTALYVRETAGTVDEAGKRLEAAVKAHKFGVLGVVDLQVRERNEA